MEVGDVTTLCGSELSNQLVLQLLIFEMLYELHDVGLHLDSVALCFVLGSLGLKVTIKRFHVQSIMRHILLIEPFLALGLGPEKPTSLRTKRNLCSDSKMTS